MFSEFHKQQLSTQKDISKRLVETKRQETEQSLAEWADTVSVGMNENVAKIFSNEQVLESEAKRLHHEAQLCTNIARSLLDQVQSFNEEFKELGDLKSWSVALEAETVLILQKLGVSMEMPRREDLLEKEMPSLPPTAHRLTCGIEYPSVIRFDKWSVNEEYSRKIVLKNLSKRTVRLTYELPQHKHFIPDYPRIINLCAGISTFICVRFRPQDKVVYKDQITFTCNETESFQVQLLGSLPKYRMDFKRFIDFGMVPVSSPTELHFPLTNSGDLPCSYRFINKEPFSSNPDNGSLQPGETRLITITFNQNRAGFVSGKILLLYGSGEKFSKRKDIECVAYAKYPNVCFETDMQALTYELDFGSVSLGSKKELSLRLFNNSEAEADIELIPIDKCVNFTVSKSKDRIRPGSSASVSFRFVANRPGYISGSCFLVKVRGGNTLQIHLKGLAEKPDVEIFPKFLDFGHCFIDQTVSKNIHFRNNSITPAFVQIKSLQTSLFQFETKSFLLKENGRYSLPVKYSGAESIHACSLIEILIEDGEPQVIHLLATSSKDFNDIPPGLHESLLKEYKESMTRTLMRHNFIATNEVVEINGDGTFEIGIKSLYPFPANVVIKAKPQNVELESFDGLIQGKSSKSLKVKVQNFRDMPLMTELDAECREIVGSVDHPSFRMIQTIRFFFTKSETSGAVADNVEFVHDKGVVLLPISPINCRTHRFIPIRNTCSNAVAVKINISEPFQAYPLCGVIMGNSVSLVEISYLATNDLAETATIELCFGGNQKRLIVKGEASSPSLKIVDAASGTINWGNLFLDSPHTKTISIHNISNFRLITQVCIHASETNLKLLSPSTFTLDRYAMNQLDFSVCSSKEENNFKIEFQCVPDLSVPSYAPKVTSFFVDVYFKAVPVSLEFWPSAIDLGHLLLNTKASKWISIHNNSPKDISMELSCMLGEKEYPGLISSMSPVRIKGQTTKQLPITFKLTSKMKQNMRIIGKLVDHESENAFLSLVSGKGVRAQIQVIDISSLGKSKLSLWRAFSIDAFNSELLKSRSDPNFVVNFDLGNSRCGNLGQTVKLLFKNVGYVPVEWSVYFTCDSIDEYDTENPFEIQPNVGFIEVGGCGSVTISFSGALARSYTTYATIEISQGWDVPPLEFRIKLNANVADEGESSFLSQEDQVNIALSSIPFPLRHYPVHVVRFANNLTKDSHFNVESRDKENSQQFYVAKNSLQRQLHIDPSDLSLMAYVKPLKPGECFASVDLNHNDASMIVNMSLNVVEKGTYQLESEKELGYSELIFPNQQIKVSRDLIDFGTVPCGSVMKDSIIIENLSKSKTFRIYWMGNDYVTVSAEVVKLLPGDIHTSEITFTPPMKPIVFDFDIEFAAEEVVPLKAKDRQSIYRSSKGLVSPSRSGTNVKRNDSKAISFSMTGTIRQLISIKSVCLLPQDFVSCRGKLEEFVFQAPPISMEKLGKNDVELLIGEASKIVESLLTEAFDGIATLATSGFKYASSLYPKDCDDFVGFMEPVDKALITQEAEKLLAGIFEQIVLK